MPRVFSSGQSKYCKEIDQMCRKPSAETEYWYKSFENAPCKSYNYKIIFEKFIIMIGKIVHIFGIHRADSKAIKGSSHCQLYHKLYIFHEKINNRYIFFMSEMRSLKHFLFFLLK